MVILGGAVHGSGVHHLVVSILGVFLGLIGSMNQVRVDCRDSSSVKFHVISGHLLVDSGVAVNEIPEV